MKTSALVSYSTLALLIAAATGRIHAQTAANPPAGGDNSPDDSIVMLSPFEVRTDKDYGYRAVSTLSGGRLSSDLQTTPAAISVLTREFLDDLGITDIQEALAWGVNTSAFSETDVTANASAGDSVNGRPGSSYNNNTAKFAVSAMSQSQEVIFPGS